MTKRSKNDSHKSNYVNLRSRSIKKVMHFTQIKKESKKLIYEIPFDHCKLT